MVRPRSRSEGAWHQTVPGTSPAASWPRGRAGGRVGEGPTVSSSSKQRVSLLLPLSSHRRDPGWNDTPDTPRVPSLPCSLAEALPPQVSLACGWALFPGPCRQPGRFFSTYVHTHASRHWVRPAGALMRTGSTKASPAESVGLSCQCQPRGHGALQTPGEHPELGMAIPASHPTPRWVTPGCPSGHL